MGDLSFLLFSLALLTYAFAIYAMTLAGLGIAALGFTAIVYGQGKLAEHGMSSLSSLATGMLGAIRESFSSIRSRTNADPDGS